MNSPVEQAYRYGKRCSTRGRIAMLLAAASMAWYAQAAQAQRYPVRPVRMIVPNLPGSATDITARAVAQRLTETWGQQVVIDNRAGASGAIAHELTARAAPDGYTLLMSTSAGLVITPQVTKVPYDSFRDFAPVSLVVISPLMLVVHAGLPVHNVNELVALARAKPGSLICASPGTGTSNHLACEMLKMMMKVEFLHVPYKGSSIAIPDLISGQVHLMFNSMSAVWPHAKTGKLRALAYAGTKRALAAPEVPTMAESIPGFQVAAWYALATTAGTPPAIVTKLNADMVSMLADPPFARRLIEFGQDPQSSTPAELTAFMRSESTRWAGVLKAAGMLPAR
jgi:tripartite-type tricarboxylate transporter receptor subunit TctC